MRIAELTLFHVRVPLRKAIKHASHRRTETENLVARCVLEDGTVGHGEGVPREYVTGETIDFALDLLRRSDVPAQLTPCADFAGAVALAERLTLAPVPGDERGIRGNAARCAVELAVLDAYGRRFGEPLSAVTRLVTPELYQPRDRVRYSGVIASARGWKARVMSWVMRVYGFKQVKVKVGIEGHDDVKRLRIIRRRVRRGTDLRVDANEAWSPEEAAERIRALEPFGISAVEQPLPQERDGALPELRRSVRTPVMLDESLCGMFDAERAISNGWCDLFNIRLSKCGGFIPSLRLARRAKEAGLGCQLGCQVGETAILSAAGRHFACSVADLRYLEGSYDRHLVREALGVRDITFGWGGRAPALAGPGLGVDIDPRALARVTLRKEALLG
ncbi:MAG TPA: enolase C-terminal domain-like protein [Gemmataceae bacterium]